MKRLLLIGGGHAHVHVLQSLAGMPIDGAQVTLITPYPRQVYSGMLPGWIAGHYKLDECVIPLGPLCERGRCNLLTARVTAIDPARRVVSLDSGATMPYDIVSIDAGPLPDLSIEGAREHALAVRPIERFIESVATLEDAIFGNAANEDTTRIAFAGAGAAGIELALALEHRYRASRLAITLYSAANTLPGKVGPRLARVLAERGIRVLPGNGVRRIEQNAVVLRDGSRHAADFTIVSTGAVPHRWPAEAGLAVDGDGFIAVNDYLQSSSHPEVFAAGDCASMTAHPRPKSGVYAVRAGPPLAENLRRALGGQPLKAYKPQPRSLYLISTGGRHAIASWGNLAWEGGWVWRWKDRIDRAFVATYAAPPAER